VIENVEPKMGTIENYYVNQMEGSYVFTKNASELHVVKTETDYIPKHLLKLDLKNTTVIRREDAFKNSKFDSISPLHGRTSELLGNILQKFVHSHHF
jgi:hypothetical protein